MQHDGDYSVRVEARLRALGITSPAAGWVMKALHPVSGAPQSIPDSQQVSCLLPEYRTNTVISAPTATGTNNWDLLLVFPPSDTIACYYATGPTGIDFRTTNGSSTGVVTHVTQNTTLATINQGLVFDIATNAFTAFGGTYFVAVSNDMPAAWRTAARSATVYSTGSDLYNQGTIYAGQYARPTIPTNLAVNFGNNYTLNQDVVSVPLSEIDMSILTPGMYTAAAREGVYTVHRLSGPAQNFTSPRHVDPWFTYPSWYVPFIGAGGQGAACTPSTLTFPSFLNSDSVHLSPAFSFGAVAGPTVPIGSSGFDQNTTWGVVICRGLHYLQSLTVKTVAVLEEVPLPNAPTRQFVTSPAKYEPTAMAAYYAIASEVPDCMAAKHNFLGTLLPILGQVATRLWPYLAPALGTLASGVAQRLLPAPPLPPAREAGAGPPTVRLSKAGRRRGVKRRVVRRKRGFRPRK